MHFTRCYFEIILFFIKFTQNKMKKILQISLFVTLAFSVNAQSDTLYDASLKLLNKKVPTYTTVTIDGKKVDSTYFLGKVTILTFFSFNCGPCLYELDILDEIVKKYPREEYQVLMIGGAADKDMRDLRAYRSNRYGKLKRKWGIDTLAFDMVADCPKNPVKFFSKSCRGSTPIFGVHSFPRTFFINKEGIIKEICFGFAIPRDKEFDEYFYAKLREAEK